MKKFIVITHQFTGSGPEDVHDNIVRQIFYYPQSIQVFDAHEDALRFARYEWDGPKEGQTVELLGVGMTAHSETFKHIISQSDKKFGVPMEYFKVTGITEIGFKYIAINHIICANIL